MKALIYKEFKLAMHPICYLFIALFPLMILIPSYPYAVGFIYVLSCYPILFLGANKGQQSNDLLFSTLLPVRKKDIVLARIFTVIFMQVAFIVIMSLLYPLAYLFQTNTFDDKGVALINKPSGLGLYSYVLSLSIGIVGFAISDLIFFPIYYKHGKSIVASTLFTILGFVTFVLGLTVAVPLIIKETTGVDYLNQVPLWIQFISLAGSIIVSFIIHIFVYKISAKELEKVDL